MSTLQHLSPNLRQPVLLFLLFGMLVAYGCAAQKSNDIEPPADVAAPPANAETTDSGLASVVLTEGTGDQRPGPEDEVTVHYTGWTTDGKMFDSSVSRGKTSSFPLDRVIAGWTEGLQLMVVGEKRRFWIPEHLAYQGRSGRPQGMLVFDVELFDIKGAPKPPPVPEDVAGPGDDATVERSGLAYKVLESGHGTKQPKSRSTVSVHYTGWTTDGRMFDSSVVRGKASAFRLDQVIRGWTVGLQKMVEGEKRRFWIPEKMAYAGMSGKPQGTLVFDIELIEIVER